MHYNMLHKLHYIESNFDRPLNGSGKYIALYVHLRNRKVKGIATRIKLVKVRTFRSL